jgi:hypothetical protein
MKVSAWRTSVRGMALCAVSIAISLSAHGATGTVTISGTPTTGVLTGQDYSFAPRAVAQGAGAPRFEIQNKPRWATFSSFSGLLSGIPAAADAGVYSAIRISITAGTLRAELPPFAIAVNGGLPHAVRAVSLNWVPPTENTDDSVLTDLAGYRIYSGASRGALKLLVTLRNPSLSRYVVESLAPGEYFFAMTAVNAAGREGPPSEIVSTRIN